MEKDRYWSLLKYMKITEKEELLCFHPTLQKQFNLYSSSRNLYSEIKNLI